MLANHTADLCKLCSTVDAADFVGPLHRIRRDWFSLLPINGDEIRQVVLALLVRGANRVERLEERLEREGVDAGVDLGNFALRVGGVALLDDLRDAAPGGRTAADDASVTK